MARIRTIKPEFFDDSDLADVSFAARLCFIGLWTQADRDGRLIEDAPRLKVRLFPHDSVHILTLLDELTEKGMVVRYIRDGKALLWIPKFAVHQRPHPKEAPSILPAPPRRLVRKNGEQCKDTTSKPDSGSLDTGVLILESGVRDKAAPSARPSDPRTENPVDNYGVIVKLAHEAYGVLGARSLSDLTDLMKQKCADAHIASTPAIIRKAIDSMLAQRKKAS